MYLGGGHKRVPLNSKLWLMADYLGFLRSVNYQADRIYSVVRVIEHDSHEQMEGRINWLGLMDSLDHLSVPLCLVTIRIGQLQQPTFYKQPGSQRLRLFGDVALADGSMFYLE